MNTWMRDADIAIANLEMALTLRGEPADKLALGRGHPGAAAELESCGFHVVTLANNHIMDYGPTGLFDTLESIDRTGLTRVGAGKDWEEAVRPLRMTLSGGRSLAIANFSCTLPPGAAAGPGSPGVAPIRVTQRYEIDPIFVQEQPGTAPWVDTYVQTQDSRAALEAVARAQHKNDLVIAIIHWGVPPHWHAPFQGDLAAYQRPLARKLIEAGASVIIGHHPHVLHGVEVIDGAPVFYSLGNFIWRSKKRNGHRSPPPYEPGYRIQWQEALKISAADPRKRESLLLDLRWERESWEARLVPLWIDDRGEPIPAEGDRREQILARLQTMSRQLGCELKLVNSELRLGREA